MKLIHQHPDNGSTVFPEYTFIRHYVLTRMACQLMAAALVLPNEMEDPDDQDEPTQPELDIPGYEDVQTSRDGEDSGEDHVDPPEEVVALDIPIDDDEDAVGAPAVRHLQVDPALLNASDLIDYYAPLDGRRTVRDPRSTVPDEEKVWPHLYGAGRPRSHLTRVFRPVPSALVEVVLRHALSLAHRQGKLVEVADPGPTHGRQLLVDKHCVYYHFHRIRLTPKVCQSSLQSVKELTTPGRSMASAFMLACIEGMPSTSESQGGHTMATQGRQDDSRPRLRPVVVRTYAMIEWAGVLALQRVAYVKVLPVMRREDAVNQEVLDVDGATVWEWESEGGCLCLPIERLREPLIVIEPPPNQHQTGTYRLVRFEGKEFGLYTRGNTLTDEEVLFHV